MWGAGQPTMPVSTLPHRRPHAEAPRLSRERRPLADGAATTVHVARFDRDAFAVSVVAIDPPATLADWCRDRLRREAVPERWFMVDKLPRNERGKMSRDMVRRALTGDIC